MGGNLFSILSELATLKQLDKRAIVDILKDGLFSSIEKKMVPENELEIVVDEETGRITAKFYRIVTEHEVGLGEIHIEDANAINSSCELGDRLPFELAIHELEPKVIKNAKRSIMEKIKKLEEDRIMFDYEKQKRQIVNGKVRKMDYNGISVDIGYAEALLPMEEQVEDEYYNVGDLIRAYVVNIRKTKNTVKVILSRTHPEFVKKLFESEIPEVFSQDIEVKKIVREPGLRTKVCVFSIDENIDAAGSCLGPKGIRIEMIRKELRGEQIDIVVWDESPEQFIANAIGSDLVERVYLADRGKFARVIVDEKNKNLAIGKKGKNVKLAAKLTDFKLDIYTAEEFEDKISEERRITSHLIELDGMTHKVADILKEHGYTSVQDIFDASLEELCELEGVGTKTAQRIKDAALYF
ncbi:MAG: transcription termination factor NusA [Candidatus Cloacimonetes bacterium]|nr:transcription termination factor NusA [Candidatus Cloacimonadota bacterium]